MKEPVLSLMAKQFDVIFNIRGSTVTAEMGLVALEIDGASQSKKNVTTSLLSRRGNRNHQCPALMGRPT